MKYHLTKTFIIQIDTHEAINAIVNQLIQYNIIIKEQTDSQLRFSAAGNFLRATHPIAWVDDGLITVSPETTSLEPQFTKITIQLNLRKIIRFLILFPIFFCSGLTLLAYSILGASIQQIMQALGLMYLLVILSMILAYFFVKQIELRFFQTLCEVLLLS